MAGLLGDVFSAADTAKRKLRGLLADPVGTLQQFVGNENDRAGQFNQLTADAAQETRQTGDLYGPKSQQLAGLLAEGYNPAGMVVWHGSPHKFAKFDSSKIGTGEGAQAYGHGLYLAESPDVANQYKTALRDEGGIKSLEQRASRIESKLSDFDGTGGKVRAARLESLSDAVKSRLNEKMMGESNSLYKVDLPDEHIAKMLDWDKPLSQQAPEVQSAWGKFLSSKQGQRYAKELGNASNLSRSASGGELTGESLIKNVMGANEAKDNYQTLASEYFRKQGIPGIRYLDGGSRGTGQGTSNFVVFPGNENLLQILERNGKPMTGLLD